MISIRNLILDWFRKAAEQGDAYAQNMLRKITGRPKEFVFDSKITHNNQKWQYKIILRQNIIPHFL